MDAVQQAARAIADSMNGRRWRERTPLDIAQALADAGLLDSVPRERYASLDQLAPGDRIWIDGGWMEVIATHEYEGDVRVAFRDDHDLWDFTAPAALLVRRAET